MLALRYVNILYFYNKQHTMYKPCQNREVPVEGVTCLPLFFGCFLNIFYLRNKNEKLGISV